MATADEASSTTPVRILIINPNTSQHMTDALVPVVESLGFPSVQFAFFTSPTPGIASINSPADAARSAEICLPHLLPLLPHHDCFLVACYSQHPLVGRLKEECAAKVTAAATIRGSHGRGARKYVTGIFEASVLASLALLGESDNVSRTATTTNTATNNTGEGISGTIKEDSIRPAFGIVSTGKIWEEALQNAVEEFIGCPTTSAATIATTTKSTVPPPPTSPFVGCETTGLNASELHDLPADQVRAKMMDATKRLLQRGNTYTTHSSSSSNNNGTGATSSGTGSEDATLVSRVQAICLGCAGMVGLDSAVRAACIDALGEERGKEVYIVDGVKAGVGTLYGLARGGF